MTLLVMLLLTVAPPDTPFEDVTDDDQGRWINVRVTFVSPEGECDGNTIYECVSSDAIVPTVHFKSLVTLNERVPHSVFGRLRVIAHPPAVIDGEMFPGFVEYRIEQARVISD